MTGFGSQSPVLRTPIPGPESVRLADELRRFESPNVTYIDREFPVFWRRAMGANVEDVDGNIYVDFTAAFAVAAAGHAHPEIVAAIREQAGLLLHGMGDVHPPEIKVELLRALAEVTPGGLQKSILANSGSEAVEAALKTVQLATGRSRVVSFAGGYHGLTFGALGISGRDDFREPFAAQLAQNRVLLPYPDPFRNPYVGENVAEASLRHVERVLDSVEGAEVGAIVTEPIQGRGGDVVPPDEWLPGLRKICDDRGILLVLDEIYTGFGRTGRWFACDHVGVVPDLLIVGKALTGGMPFAACIGTEDVMSAWPESTGEAIHTSTFLGHPLGCAAALASIELIRRMDLPKRAAEEGDYLMGRLRETIGGSGRVGEIRGRGLMIGIDLVRGDGSSSPDREAAVRIMTEALRQGYLLLGGGLHSNVLSLSPPLTMPRGLIDEGVDLLQRLIREI